MPSQPSGPSVPENYQPRQEDDTFDPNDERPTEPEKELSGIYAELAEPFDVTFTDVRGSVELTYISGEQVTSRLNLVLGPQNWSFTVLRDGYEAGLDWLWCLGHLEAIIDGARCVREQYGGAQLKRSVPLCGYTLETGPRTGEVCDDKKYGHEQRHRDHTYVPQALGPALNLGYDKKAAATDAFKKCAQGIGVGLYLSARVKTPDGKGRSAAIGNGQAASRPNARGPQQRGTPSNGKAAAPRPAPPPGSLAPVCGTANCGKALEPFVHGKTNWSVEQLGAYSRQLTRELLGVAHEKPLCGTHYLAALEHKKRLGTEQEQKAAAATTS